MHKNLNHSSSCQRSQPKGSKTTNIVSIKVNHKTEPTIQNLREIANQLKLYNVGISIDDFGSASASLSRLNDLPFTEVKIDRGFVLGCSSNQLKHSVCQTVIDLAHRFGATVCAEGVETVEDLRALIAMQCDSVQGYVFASPMPAAEFASLLLSGSFESIKSLLQTPDGRGTSAGAKRLGSA
jgi:EAL domain-containing protein (putative c-di-GMP-specific phosphodiesterase class I)